MIKIAIIDDNKGARSAIKNILEFNFVDTFKIEEANSVLSGHKLILEFKPEIVLLDIEMADGSGLDLLALFENLPFKVIFITAHKEYAIQAIKYRPFDYLIKPINPFDLIKITNHLLKQSSSSQSNDKIVIKNHDTTILLEQNEIIRCEADGAYTKIITVSDVHVASKHLKHFEEVLSRTCFLRVHNTHLININFVKIFNRHLQNGIIMTNGDKVPVSVRKVKDISAFLNSLS